MNTRTSPTIGTWCRQRFQRLEVLCALAGWLGLFQPIFAQEPPPTSTVQVASFAYASPQPAGTAKDRSPEEILRNALVKSGLKVATDAAAAGFIVEVRVTNPTPKHVEARVRLRRASDDYSEQVIVSSAPKPALAPNMIENWTGFITKRLRNLETGAVALTTQAVAARTTPAPPPAPTPSPPPRKSSPEDLLARFPPPPHPTVKAPPPRPQNGPLELAVVTDATNETLRAIVDRLNADLSNEPNLALVERQDLPRILNEQGGAGATLRAGQLVHADVLATLRSGPGFVTLRLVDVRRGWVHAARTFAWPGDASELHDNVLARIKTAVAMARQPDERLKPVAVATFLSGDVDRSLDRLQEDLPAVLEEQLLRDGSVVPLDRSALMEIVEENALAGGADDLRGATHFVEGRFTSRRDSGGVSLHLTVTVHGPGAAGVAWEGDAAVAGLRTTLAQAASAVVARVRGGPAAAKANIDADAAQARERADFFWQHGDRHRGLEALESAWLLCPTQDLWYAQIRQWRSELAQGGFQPNETPQQAARRLNLFVQCFEEAQQWLTLPTTNRPPFPHPWVKSFYVERYAGEPGCIAAWLRWSELQLEALRTDWRADAATNRTGAAASGKSPANDYAQQIASTAHLFARMRPTEAQWFGHFLPLLERRIEMGGDPVTLNEELGQLLYRITSNDGGDPSRTVRVRLLDELARRTSSPAVARLATLHGAMVISHYVDQRGPEREEVVKRLKSLFAGLVRGPAAATPLGLNERSNLYSVWLTMQEPTFRAGLENLPQEFQQAVTAGGAMSPAAESFAASLCRTREGARFLSNASWDDLVLSYLETQRTDRTFLEQFCAEAARELARRSTAATDQARLTKFRAFAERHQLAWAAPTSPAKADAAAASASTAAATNTPRYQAVELADFARYRDPATGEFHMREPSALLTRHGRLYAYFADHPNHTVGEFQPATRTWKWLQPIPRTFAVYTPAHLFNEGGCDGLDLATSDDGLFVCQAGSGLLFFGFNGWSKAIGPQDGVPSNTVFSLAFAGSTGYAGCNGGVACWDRAQKSWDVLFGARRPADANPLNGGDHYNVTDIEVDEPRHRLVFTVTGSRAGLWSYDLNAKSAEKLLPFAGKRPTRDGDWLFLSDDRTFIAYNLRDAALSRGYGDSLPAGFRAPKPQPSNRTPRSYRLAFPAAPLGEDLLFCIDNSGLYRWDEDRAWTSCDVNAPGRCGSLVAWNGGVAASRDYKVLFYSRTDAPPPAFTAAPPSLVASSAAPVAAQTESVRFVPHTANVAIRVPFVADGLARPELDDMILKRDWSDLRDIISCGPDADLLWCEDDLYLQREAGKLQPIAAAHKQSFCDFAWDGQNIWAATTNRGLVVFDSAGRVRTTVDHTAQLPAADAGLRVCALTTNRVFVAGGSTNPAVGWCALVELTARGARVDLLHRAEKPASASANPLDAALAFRPAGLFAWHGGATTPGKVIVGRGSERYEISTRPLVVDLQSRDVTVAECTMGMARSRHQPSYLEKDDLILEAGSTDARVFPPFDAQTPARTLQGDSGPLKRERNGPEEVLDTSVLLRDPAGPIYFCGRTWYCLDPLTWSVRRVETHYPAGLELGEWPVWRTAHLGVVSIHNGQLYRVVLPGAETSNDRK